MFPSERRSLCETRVYGRRCSLPSVDRRMATDTLRRIKKGLKTNGFRDSCRGLTPAGVEQRAGRAKNERYPIGSDRMCSQAARSGVNRRVEGHALPGWGGPTATVEPSGGHRVGNGSIARRLRSSTSAGNPGSSPMAVPAPVEPRWLSGNPRHPSAFSRGARRSSASSTRPVGGRRAACRCSIAASESRPARRRGAVRARRSSCSRGVGRQPAHALHTLAAVDPFDSASPQELAVSWNQERMR